MTLPTSVLLASTLRSVPAQGLGLEGPIDLSVHWLRESQDAATGSYGGSVEATAWALRALHDGPRHYRKGDGPFVSRAVAWLAAAQRADGAICGEKADAKAAANETASAVMALKLYADDSNKDVLAKALAFVGRQEGLAQPDASLALPADAKSAEAIATKLLAARAPDRSWDGERGKLVETARNVVV